MPSPTDVQHRNYVTTLGGGDRSLIFVNGFGCDQTIWRAVAPAFASEYRVVLFDHMGSGRSDMAAYEPSRYASLGGYAADLVEVAEALGLRNAVVVAHSVGCTMAVQAALAAPERFERLVLVTPSPRFLNDPPDYVGGFERPDIDALLELMGLNFLGWAAALTGLLLKEPEHQQQLRDSFCSLDPRVARQFAALAFLSDTRADLPHVTQPGLVLQCSRDDVVPVGVGEYVSQQLQRGRYALLDASGHCPHVSHPSQVEAHVRAFLDEPPPVPAL